MSNVQNKTQLKDSTAPRGFILDDLISYFTLLPNAEVGISLAHILLAFATWYIVISHLKWHINKSDEDDVRLWPLLCFKLLASSMVSRIECILVIALNVISTFMCYAIYIHLRAKCIVPKECMVLLLVPLYSFYVGLAVLFVSAIRTRLYIFSDFIYKFSLPTVKFWLYITLEIIIVLVEYICALYAHSSLYMKWFVVVEGIVGAWYLVYLMRLPRTIRNTYDARHRGKSKVKESIHISSIEERGSERQSFLRHGPMKTDKVNDNGGDGVDNEQHNAIDGGTGNRPSKLYEEICITAEAEVHVHLENTCKASGTAAEHKNQQEHSAVFKAPPNVDINRIESIE